MLPKSLIKHICDVATNDFFPLLDKEGIEDPAKSKVSIESFAKYCLMTWNPDTDDLEAFDKELFKRDYYGDRDRLQPTQEPDTSS